MLKLSNGTYDFLKWFSLIFLPALAVFIGTIGDSVGIPKADVIVLVINAFAVFLGSCLQISSANYHKEQESNEE